MSSGGHQRNSVFVRNLPHESNQDQLKRIFQDYGQIRDIFIPRDNKTGRHKMYAFIEYSTIEETDRAVKKGDGVLFCGRALQVTYAVDTRQDARQKSASPKRERNRSRSPRRNKSTEQTLSSSDRKLKTKISDLIVEKETLSTKYYGLKRECDESRNKNSQYREHLDSLKREIQMYKSDSNIYLPWGHSKVLRNTSKKVLEDLYDEALNKLPKDDRENAQIIRIVKGRIYRIMESKYPEMYRCRTQEKCILCCGHKQMVDCLAARDFNRGIRQIQCTFTVYHELPWGHTVNTKCGSKPECTKCTGTL